MSVVETVVYRDAVVDEPGTVVSGAGAAGAGAAGAGGESTGTGGAVGGGDLGLPCLAADDCGSGHCVDGVCCESACDGPCDRCDAAGEMGACIPRKAREAPEVPCGYFLCDGVGHACADGCEEDADCTSNAGCGFGHCGGRLVHTQTLDGNYPPYNSEPALADIDADGDVDAVVGSTSFGGTQVWLNDGSGFFTESVQDLPNAKDVELADMDGDGLPDIVAALAGKSMVWWNAGGATFIADESPWMVHSGFDVEVADVEPDGVNELFADAHLELADMDGDGHVDRVRIDSKDHFAVELEGGDWIELGHVDGPLSLGDIDGDGDADAIVGGSVFTNDGSGNLNPTGQSIAWTFWDTPCALGDLDGDADLDLVATPHNALGNVWFNDGSGVFYDSGQQLPATLPWSNQGVAVADLDGDGDLDALVVGVYQHFVFLNQ